MVTLTRVRQITAVTNILQSPFGDQGWFENQHELLLEQIDKSINTRQSLHTRAVIAPHAGYRWCGDVFGSVMSHVHDNYDRVIIIGPSHRVRFNNMFVGCDFDCVSTPLGDCEVMKITSDVVTFNNNIHYNEHSIQMHVPYVQRCCPQASIVPLLVSNYDTAHLHKLAECIKNLVDDETLIMISSDFTHHGDKFNYKPYHVDVEDSIERFDRQVIEHIINNDITSLEDVAANENTICGINAIRLLMHVFDDCAFDAELCKYNMSGNLTNDYTNTVSYAGIHIS